VAAYTSIFAGTNMARRKNKNIIWKLLLGLVIGSVVVLSGFWFYEWWMERRAHFVRYAAFGTDIPVNYSIHGIDVSKYQEIIDWQSVKAMNVEDVRLQFAFIKATEGNVNTDHYFKRNWKKAADAGMTRGAYHFFVATKNGKTQAENFISCVDIASGDLPPVLDVEQTNGVSGQRLRERVKEFLNTVENHYGIKPIIYTNVDFYKQYLKDEFDEYPLWVAHYLQKERPRIHRPWQFWQHSETGRVNGILYKVDFNVFSGDSTEFRKLLVP
jgi:lysozyme